VRRRPRVGRARAEGGAFYSANLLLQALLVAKRDLKLSCVLKRLRGCEVLMLGDLGHAQQSREEMEVLFTLLAEKYERGNVLLTGNLAFSGWEQTFKDPTMTAASIDRLVHHCLILELNAPRCRVAQARTAKQSRTSQGEDVRAG
jgi:DNA replication protein DnaC